MLLTLAACCSRAPDPLTEVLNPTGLHFHPVMGPDDPGTTAFLYEGKTLHLGPQKTFQLSRVHRTLDINNRPALGFELAAQDQDAFEALTTSLGGSRMAIVVGNRVITAPAFNEPLRLGGQITGGRDGFSEQEVQDLLTALIPQSD